MSHQQLTQEERYSIHAYRQAEFTVNEIARELCRHRSTIFRELQRNTGLRGYRPKQANEMALKRRYIAVKAIKFTDKIKRLVNEKINLDWSPEQIAGWISIKPGISISYERIYQHIYADKAKGGNLHLHLRCQKKRKKRYGSGRDRRGQILNRRSIEERPAIVETKSRIGDWEGDTVIGKNHKGAIVTLVDRKSKKTLMKKVDSKEAAVVGAAIVELLKGEIVKSITFDNGKEFAFHEEMAKKLNTPIFFAHPYSSWERGLNENTNGLIRQYFAKGSSFDDITDDEILRVTYLLNTRPRKILGYNNPNDIYSGLRRCPKVAIMS